MGIRVKDSTFSVSGLRPEEGIEYPRKATLLALRVALPVASASQPGDLAHSVRPARRRKAPLTSSLAARLYDQQHIDGQNPRFCTIERNRSVECNALPRHIMTRVCVDLHYIGGLRPQLHFGDIEALRLQWKLKPLFIHIRQRDPRTKCTLHCMYHSLKAPTTHARTRCGTSSF